MSVESEGGRKARKEEGGRGGMRKRAREEYNGVAGLII